MRIIKPQALGVLYQPFTQHSHYLCVAALALFRFDEETLEHEAVMWQLAADEIHSGIVDEICPKPVAEVIVDGFAYRAHSSPSACEVRVKLGAMDKLLLVGGGSDWTATTAGPDTPPFERHRVMGFSACGADHPARLRFAGSYDARWQKERAPYLPDDHDLRYQMLTSPDQWMQTFPVGDEGFAIEHMHPTRKHIESQLPGFSARCIIGDQQGALQHVPMRLDTVRLFPHRQLGLLVFRGLVPVEEDDASDVAWLMVACEHARSPRTEAHYEAAVRLRLDDETSLQACLDDGPLLPDGMLPPSAPTTVPAAAGIIAQRARCGAQAELDAARQQLVEQGVDPDKHGLPKTIAAPPKDAPADIAQAQREVAAAKQQAEQEHIDAEEQARAPEFGRH